MKQAKRLVDEAANSEFTDQSFQQIMQLLDKAEAEYGSVLELKVDSAEYGVPMDYIARLSLGDVQVTRGRALQGYINYDPANEDFNQAAQMFNQAIQTLKDTLPAFQARSLSRYLAQNHLFLGMAYRSSGYLAFKAGDPSTARQDYQKAIEQFDACIALGKNTNDRVIQSESIGTVCLSWRQDTEELLQALEGGS
jgi:tetratricopeptide (TPR) repeat protein